MRKTKKEELRKLISENKIDKVFTILAFTLTDEALKNELAHIKNQKKRLNSENLRNTNKDYKIDENKIISSLLNLISQINVNDDNSLINPKPDEPPKPSSLRIIIGAILLSGIMFLLGVCSNKNGAPESPVNPIQIDSLVKDDDQSLENTKIPSKKLDSLSEIINGLKLSNEDKSNEPNKEELERLNFDLANAKSQLINCTSNLRNSNLRNSNSDRLEVNLKNCKNQLSNYINGTIPQNAKIVTHYHFPENDNKKNKEILNNIRALEALNIGRDSLSMKNTYGYNVIQYLLDDESSKNLAIFADKKIQLDFALRGVHHIKDNEIHIYIK